MSTKRMNHTEVKAHWCDEGADIYATVFGGYSAVCALPKKEVKSGLKYYHALSRCQNYQDFYDLYLEFAEDPAKPRFAPLLQDPLATADYRELLMHRYFEEHSGEYATFDEFEEEMLGQELLATFSDMPRHEFETYAINANPADIKWAWNPEEGHLFSNAMHWVEFTDAWVPSEVIAEIGIASDQYAKSSGEPVYVFPNLESFKGSLEKLGFTVEVDHPELIEYLKLDATVIYEGWFDEAK